MELRHLVLGQQTQQVQPQQLTPENSGEYRFVMEHSAINSLEVALCQAGVIIVIRLKLGHVSLEHGDVSLGHGELGTDLERVARHRQLLGVRRARGQEGEGGEGDLELAQQARHLHNINVVTVRVDGRV